MNKAQKVEIAFGLVGSILGIIAFVLSIFFGIAWAYKVGILIPIITALLLMIAFVCGFKGVGMLKRINKNGGVVLIVASGISLIALILCFVAAWFAGFSLIFLLAGGIMTLIRKLKTPTVQ